MSSNLEVKNQKLLQKLLRGMKMSQGKFRLFLVCFSYSRQRDRLIEKLRVSFPGVLAELQLNISVRKIYGTIREYLEDKQPDALMVWGWESLQDIDKLLVAMGNVREEFRNHSPLPIVFWLDRKVSRKFIRLIPDFESWTSLTVFEPTTNELIDFVQQTSESVYHTVLEIGAGIFLDYPDLGLPESIYQDLVNTRQELANREIILEPELEASLEFVLGRVADNSQEIAREHYQQSLELWQELNYPLRVAHTYYHLGLWWQSYAVKHRAEKDMAYEKTCSYFQMSVQGFEAANRQDLVAKFINVWGEVLQTLKNWEQLKIVAKKAIKLHQTYSYSFREARAYGFLAEFELAKSNYKQAQKLAYTAIKIFNETITTVSITSLKKDQISLDRERLYHRGWYLFSLAKAEKGLDYIKSAIASLEQAKNTTNPEYDAELYINILTELRESYYRRKEYIEAFKIKQERQKIEQEFGFQAFVGANRLRNIKENLNPALPYSKQKINQTEIAASGRESDIDKLLEKISIDNYILIVIYGESGVGKSSILQAGLMPALEKKSIDTRDVVVVLQRVYFNWISKLGELLAEQLQITQNLAVSSEDLNSTKAIFSQLQNNSELNLLTVIIFDQFEEFFFVNSEPQDKREFAQFLQNCLEIPFVKIILSLREDYIHYLLDFNRLGNLEVINNDILSKNILYYLGNFTPLQAKFVIKELTGKSQFKIDSELKEKLVEDLAEELEEVRPIELQIVGAQLQTENITTLEKYQKLGDNPKAKLVERYLEEVVQDCGEENEKSAWLVLWLLTDENNNRPLKTKLELLKESQFNLKKSELELVLDVFVGSGLVFLLPEKPADRYQFVHDYLVGFIRQRKGKEILKELKQEKQKRQQLQKLSLTGLVASLSVMSLLAGSMTRFALRVQQAEAEKQTIILARESFHRAYFKDALAFYKQAEKIDPTQISADNWNTLCRYGSLYQQAADVIFACEKAVALNPKSADFFDSRGLARALTGDIEGAIADFQVYIKWADDEEEKAKRQEWIKALQVGENPFTDEVLKELRE